MDNTIKQLALAILDGEKQGWLILGDYLEENGHKFDDFRSYYDRMVPLMIVKYLPVEIMDEVVFRLIDGVSNNLGFSVRVVHSDTGIERTVFVDGEVGLRNSRLFARQIQYAFQHPKDLNVLISLATHHRYGVPAIRSILINVLEELCH